jgi:transposase
MGMTTDEVKRVPLVRFLERVYGMTFRKTGTEYCALSPLSDETRPSFFVREVDDGHWLFKDFSSGEGGSIIDFVRIKEGLGHDIPAIVERIEELWRGGPAPARAPRELPVDKAATAGEKLSVAELLGKIEGNDLEPVRAYLRGRGIGEEVIAELERRSVVCHNRYQGKSFATFVARDPEGSARCLANEEVKTGEKFIYGRKYPFSPDPKAVKEATEVYITEGVVDLLSLKTLLGERCQGLALLGNDPKVVDGELVDNAEVIHAAMDTDDAGLMGLLDFPEVFPGREIRPLGFDEVKDPNELLMKLRNKRESIPPAARAWLYAHVKVTKNKAELARRWGVDRSYLYTLLEQGDEALQTRFSERRRGRPPAGKPRTLQEALAWIEELEREKHEVEVRYEEEHVKGAFASLRLKWAEEELEEHGLRKKDGSKEHRKKNKRSS